MAECRSLHIDRKCQGRADAGTARPACRDSLPDRLLVGRVPVATPRNAVARQARAGNSAIPLPGGGGVGRMAHSVFDFRAAAGQRQGSGRAVAGQRQAYSVFDFC
jgi:hypothetical protein